MQRMLDFAKNFNQNLENWKFNQNANISNFLLGTALDCSNYSNSLIGWASNPTNQSITTGLIYNLDALEAMKTLYNNFSWNLPGYLGVDCNQAALITTWDIPSEGLDIETIGSYTYYRSNPNPNNITAEIGNSGITHIASGNGNTITIVPNPNESFKIYASSNHSGYDNQPF